MGLDEKKILQAIEEDMNVQANMVIDVVKHEIETMHDEKIHSFERGLKNETETYLERQMSDLQLQAKTRVSQDRLKKRRDLLKLRQEMTASLMDEVSQKVKDFVASDAYQGFLEQHLDLVEVGSGYFTVSERDVSLLEELLKKRGLSNEVRTAYFAFGGFRYVDEEERFEYACDLSERLQDAHAYFLRNSNFTFAKGGVDDE